jgi:hypothetical protein
MNDEKLIEVMALEFFVTPTVARNGVKALRAAGYEIVKPGHTVESIARADVDQQEQLVERVLSAEAENERLREAAKQASGVLWRVMMGETTGGPIVGAAARALDAALKETSHD